MASFGFVSTLSVPTNVFVVGLYQLNSDSSQTLLETQIPTKAGSVPYYTTPFSVAFTTTLLPGTVYVIILWENSTPVVGGLSKISGYAEPSGNVTTIRENDELIVGTTSGLTAGATTYTNASYIGWDIWLERNGSGTMFNVAESDYTFNNTTGLITLTDGTTFNNNEKYTVHFYPQISTATPPPASLISSGRIITADTTLTSSDLNSAIILQGASSVINITLPTSIPDWKRLYIYSMGGNHLNANIICQSTDKIQRNILLTLITLGQGEFLELYKAFGNLNVANDLNGVDAVGELFESYTATELNAVIPVGQLLSRTTYARLWAWVQAKATIISDSSFANVDVNGNFINKGFFTSGDGSTTFRCPDLTVYGFRRGNVAAGVYQAEMIGPHNHVEQVYQAVNNGGNKPVGFSGTTGGATGAAGTVTADNTGTENRPATTGINVFIRI